MLSIVIVIIIIIIKIKKRELAGKRLKSLQAVI